VPSLIKILELPFIEIGGSIMVGAVMGYALNWLMHRMKNRHDAMAVSVGFVLLAAGISMAMDFSLILTTMLLGMVMVNYCPEYERHIRYTIEQAMRDNLGFRLFSQAGVAIGLILASSARFSQYGEEGQALGKLIINVITAQLQAPTFLVRSLADRCVSPFGTTSSLQTKSSEPINYR
jgi:NhaP-type Na+/H+ or K+/H+ antiporter